MVYTSLFPFTPRQPPGNVTILLAAVWLRVAMTNRPNGPGPSVGAAELPQKETVSWPFSVNCPHRCLTWCHVSLGGRADCSLAFRKGPQ